MFDLVLILEDKNDVIFLRDFILKNYCGSDISKAKKLREKEYKVECNSKIILIKDTNKESDFSETGGWTKIQGLINSETLVKFKNFNENIKFIALLDADEDKSDNIAIKEKDINSWLENKSFNIDRFYIPFNTNESLNLEQLLELSFNKNIKECWNQFMECMLNDTISGAIEPESKKGKIIIYKEIYSNFRNKNNEYLSDMWNLDVNTNEYLKPLKEFLDQYLK